MYEESDKCWVLCVYVNSAKQLCYQNRHKYASYLLVDIIITSNVPSVIVIFIMTTQED